LSVTADTEAPWSEDGQEAIYMVVDNISNSLCSITGYADVAPFDAAGHAINVTYEHGSFGSVPIPDPGIYRTPEVPGELAYFGVTWTTGTGPNCSAATHFLVSLPAPDATSMTVNFRDLPRGCELSAPRGHRGQPRRVVHRQSVPPVDRMWLRKHSRLSKS
jgi:hypothetical protein